MSNFFSKSPKIAILIISSFPRGIFEILLFYCWYKSKECHESKIREGPFFYVSILFLDSLLYITQVKVHLLYQVCSSLYGPIFSAVEWSTSYFFTLTNPISWVPSNKKRALISQPTLWQQIFAFFMLDITIFQMLKFQG